MDDIPVVSITTLVPTHEGLGRHRTMGFVTDALPGGFRLVATCQHGHREQWRNKRTQVYMALAGKGVQPFRVLGKAMADVSSAADLYFVLVWDPNDLAVGPFVLGPEDPQITEPVRLYNARNLTEFNGSSIRFLQEVAVQEGVVELTTTAFTKRGKYDTANWDNPQKSSTLAADGWQANRMFAMQSRPGYSGSPIWDEARTLYGMNLGGTSGTGRDELVCLPRSAIYSARKNIEGRLQKRLSELGSL